MTGRHSVPTAQVPGDNAAGPLPHAESSLPSSRPSGPPVHQSHPSSPFFSRTLLVTNVLLLLLLAAQVLHRPKYEYMTASPSDLSFSEEMNRLGAQGWHTQSCRRASDGAEYSPKFSYECIMSRPKLGW